MQILTPTALALALALPSVPCPEAKPLFQLLLLQLRCPCQPSSWTCCCPGYASQPIPSCRRKSGWYAPCLQGLDVPQSLLNMLSICRSVNSSMCHKVCWTFVDVLQHLLNMFRIAVEFRTTLWCGTHCRTLHILSEPRHVQHNHCRSCFVSHISPHRVKHNAKCRSCVLVAERENGSEECRICNLRSLKPTEC